jgi:NAD+ diphosphatase
MSDDIAANSHWFVFAGDRLLLHGDEQPAVPDYATLVTLGIRPERPLLLGDLDCTPCYAANAPEIVDAPGIRPVDLRQAHGLLGEHLYGIANFASQVAYWDRTSRFCSICGAPTEASSTERAKICTGCAHTQYPRVSPAIIVLIYREGQVLLTRQPRWTPGMYSLVAGFVEAGESLEACLRREIAEEVGVQVDLIEYLGSQPWPFPHQLMVGFRARYCAGEVAVDPTELEDAVWFNLDALPILPSPMSISRQIINWHLASQQEPGLPFPEM